jgi:hypothetical protein
VHTNLILIAIMPSVIHAKLGFMLSVIMLSVVAPLQLLFLEIKRFKNETKQKNQR